MRLEHRYPVGRIATIALWSSVFTSLAVTTIAFPTPFISHSKSSAAAWYLPFLAVGIAALVVSYRATTALGRGVEQELWDKPSLDRLYTRLDVSGILALTVILIATVLLVAGLIFAYTATTPAQHHWHGNGGLIYFWLSPVTTWGALKNAIRPKPNAGSPSIWTTDVKPISSDHWGEY